MSLVVIAWLAITIAPPAQRGLWTGLALAAFSLPASLGTVLFGRWAARLPGARLVVADSALRAACLTTVVALGLAGALTPVRYVVLLAFSSLLQAWGQAGKYTVVAEMLPDDLRVAGNALISVLTQTALIVGPAVAGLAIPSIGPVWALFSVGAVIGGLAAAGLRHRPLWTVVTLIVIGWGCSLLPLGLSSRLWPGLIGFALGGMIYGPFTSVTTALFQRSTPPDQLSRVLAARSALTIPSTATGTLLGGPLVGTLGAQATLLWSGLLTIALGAGLGLVRLARSKTARA